MFTEPFSTALYSVAEFAVNPDDAKRARASAFFEDQDEASVVGAACFPRWPRLARPGMTEEGNTEALGGV